jgi:hypothetical protein
VLRSRKRIGLTRARLMGVEAATAPVLTFLGKISSQDLYFSMHRKKSFLIFPSPAGISLTKLSLGGNYDIIYKLFLPRESLVSNIPAGDGNIKKLVLRCVCLQSPCFV